MSDSKLSRTMTGSVTGPDGVLNLKQLLFAMIILQRCQSTRGETKFIASRPLTALIVTDVKKSSTRRAHPNRNAAVTNVW